MKKDLPPISVTPQIKEPLEVHIPNVVLRTFKNKLCVSYSIKVVLPSALCCTLRCVISTLEPFNRWFSKPAPQRSLGCRSKS